MKYHIWTTGCQMNVADSQRVASALERLGYQAADKANQADILVLNTCVVRQSAEDKAHGYLQSLKPLKTKKSQFNHQPDGLHGRCQRHRTPGQTLPPTWTYSHRPSDPGPLRSLTLHKTKAAAWMRWKPNRRYALMDGELTLPVEERGNLVSGFVPIVLGCSHACTYCIIPYRRGIERSRAVGDIVAEVRSLVAQGVKEITLLGQIVDRYGKDIPDGPNLAQLLRLTAQVEGLERLRFLTSHPNWMTEELLETVAELPVVMPHIEVPIQAGNDQVLANMKREYSAEDYRILIEKIRRIIPNVSYRHGYYRRFPPVRPKPNSWIPTTCWKNYGWTWHTWRVIPLAPAR